MSLPLKINPSTMRDINIPIGQSTKEITIQMESKEIRIEIEGEKERTKKTTKRNSGMALSISEEIKYHNDNLSGCSNDVKCTHSCERK